MKFGDDVVEGIDGNWKRGDGEYIFVQKPL